MFVSRRYKLEHERRGWLKAKEDAGWFYAYLFESRFGGSAHHLPSSAHDARRAAVHECLRSPFTTNDEINITYWYTVRTDARFHIEDEDP